MGLDAFHARCATRIEALNHALRNIPEDRVRYHLYWGSWHGQRAFDLELELELDRIVDLMLKVKAQAYLIEVANARHEHEVAVWEKVKLPEGKILVPGVVAPFDRRGRASGIGLATVATLFAVVRQRT
jgi:5-methyltetrahydropteroyltriglutamate--homocysteine methyltransferase